MSMYFILGGARSGKSSYAITAATPIPGKKAFVATAEARDNEMEERIKRHRDERGVDWYTYEEPINLAGVLSDMDGQYDVILVDCLTLWMSNILISGLDPKRESDTLIGALQAHKAGHLYIISNEVGLGIVPENVLARAYRDHLGALNRRVAQVASTVIFMLAGIPMTVK